ncbi:Mss4-like protein [Immersiella caudata]|uniref:Mss4-like protein n=1 Tax=Immersiella caudata TaxID=314043 RepID=A0AA39U421_9PEZI|nr:Mss4-like protein [Immersiella caudata]
MSTGPTPTTPPSTSAMPVTSNPNTDADAKATVASCPCNHLRYSLLSKPLIIHCCHCLSCQSETGSAFVLNALYLASSVVPLSPTTSPLLINTPSASGKGQVIARCPRCFVAVWSNYAGGGRATRFVRVGAVEKEVKSMDPGAWAPDVHIYVRSKVPWLAIPEGAEVYERFYDVEEVWGRERCVRRADAREKIKKAREEETTEAEGAGVQDARQ